MYWLSPFGLLFLAIVLYFAFVERTLYMRLAPAEAVEKIYRRLYRLGRPLAGERARAETVYEFMQKLLYRLDQIKLNSRRSRYLVQAEKDVGLLTHVYQAILFTHSRIDKKDALEALEAWKRLRWRLWVARLNVIAGGWRRGLQATVKRARGKPSTRNGANLQS